MSHYMHQKGPGISTVHQTKDGEFQRGVTANQKATLKAFDRFYGMFPTFLDLFPDEDAFLEFAIWFVALTIVTVIILSRFIKITPSTYC